MKFKLGIAAPGFALLLGVGLVGCAQNDDYVPAKRAGFRPPSGPIVPNDLPPVENQTEIAQDAPPSNDLATLSRKPPLDALPDPGPQTTQTTPAPQPAPSQPQPPVPPPQPEPPKKAAAPEYAKKVPGKPGWIRSPYDNKVLDASGIPPGTEVKDPTSGRIMLVP